jgi:hypothetical protein
VGLRFCTRVSNPGCKDFWCGYEAPEDIAFRTVVLDTLIIALDHEHVNVDTLIIDHLQDFTPGVCFTPVFQNVRDKLKSLLLRVAMKYSDHGPDGDIDIPEKHDFFNHESNTH